MKKIYAILMLMLPTVASFAQCPAVSDFSESFDATADIPECWSTLRINPPISPYAVVQVQTNAANSFLPPNLVRMFNQLGGEADFYLISPEVSNLGDGDHQLPFVYRGQPNNDGLDAIIQVGTMTDPADENTFTPVQTLSGTSDAFQEFTVPFTDASTDTYIAIKADFQVTFRNLYFDDVNWEAMPTCPKPTALEALNLTSSSADLSWTAGGSETEWEIVYGPAGFDPETEGTTLTDTDGTPGETISDLSIGTDYEFYVKAICGSDDQSVWSFAGAFATLCDVYPLDYAQTFDTFMPNCWTEADAGTPDDGPATFGSSNWTDANYLNNPANGPAVKILLFGNTVSDWMISPEIELSTAAELTYDVGITTLNGTTGPAALGADDEIRVLITTDDGATWTTLKTYNNDAYPTAEGTTETIDLSALSGTVKFAFWATNGAISDTPETYDVFFDNFAVTALILPCQPVSEVQIDGITENSAQVSWVENGDAVMWEVVYDVSGFDPSAGGIFAEVSTSPETTLADLLPATSYDVYVRALCGNDSSEWVGPAVFTTATSGIGEVRINGLSVYPNPVRSRLTVSATTPIDHVRIYNITGQMVYQDAPTQSEFQIAASGLSQGVYLMQISSGNTVQTVRFVKE